MISLSLDHPFSRDYPQESTAHQAEGSASPNTVTHDHPVTSEKSAVDKEGAVFIKAPQKFFGKFLEVNVVKRTPEEKEANQAVRTEFQEKLHGFFGPILTEYLYPRETHEQTLQEGAPLMPQQAQKIVSKGIEMMDALAKYCEHYLDDDAEKSSSQADRLDQAMMRYANEQDAAASKKGSYIDVLPHAASAIGGGAMAAFAVTTMGHLAPADIFFLVDLLSSKKLSKGMENFITTRLLQHIAHHLESYLEERRDSRQPLSAEEEAGLRSVLKNHTQVLSQDYSSPSAKSCAIRAANLSMGGGSDIHHPIDAINYIFLSPLEGVSAGGAHNRLFRDGVTAVIENVKKIQESVSKTESSTEELLKIKKAITTACEGAGTWREVEDQETVKTDAAAPAKKKGLLPPPWRRGI
ncbi:MAG: hypothetical protein K2W97_07920 [Chthoniobacterales bacterium]|nr:hypothetical protein [Chthoniobacterales bacterium]